MYERNDENDCADSDDELPPVDGIKLKLESVSDSSDWNHEGNGVPCRFYNHDGCLRGPDCRFSHAPDHRSVRDRLYVLSKNIWGLLFPAWLTVLGYCSGDATSACTSYWGTACSIVAHAYTLTIRRTCRLAAGGKTKATVTFSAPSWIR